MSYFDLLDNFNVGLTLLSTYIFSFFAILSLAFLINKLTHRIRGTANSPKRIALALNSFELKRLSAMGLFVLFVHRFLWLTQLFLTNNIKTNKVVSFERKLLVFT